MISGPLLSQGSVTKLISWQTSTQKYVLTHTTNNNDKMWRIPLLTSRFCYLLDIGVILKTEAEEHVLFCLSPGALLMQEASSTGSCATNLQAEDFCLMTVLHSNYKSDSGKSDSIIQWHFFKGILKKNSAVQNLHLLLHYSCT